MGNLARMFENMSIFFKYEFIYRHNYLRYVSYPIGILIITTCFMYGQWPSRYDLFTDTFGDKLFAYLMTIAILISAFIGSLHSGISFSTEKEKKTLTLLRMSGLDPFEIFMGKAFTSFLFILYLLMPHLPFALICPFIGGISFLKMLEGLIIFLVIGSFYTIAGAAISVHFKKNFTAIAATLMFMFFIHFGLYIVDNIIFEGYYPRDRMAAGYFSPVELWTGYFRDVLYEEGAYRYYRYESFIHLPGELKLPIYRVVTGFYFLLSVFLCRFMSNWLEKYLKWRGE